MARKPRIEYPGAFYHVICRGNQRQVIFRSDADRKRYLERLEHYRQRYGFSVYAYVLDEQSRSFADRNRQGSLVKIMQGLQFTYTGYYNRKYQKVGHLFQGRYKAILCDREAYLLELVRYLTSQSGTNSVAHGPVEVSMQPCGILRQGELSQGRDLGGIGRVGQVFGPSKARLLKVYGGRKGVRAPGGLL